MQHLNEPASPRSGPAIVGVFEGGGIGSDWRGRLQPRWMRRTFERVIGTSAGALVGSLVAAGYSGRELRTVVGEVGWSDLLDPPLVSEIPWIGRHLAMVAWNGIYRRERLERTWRRLLAAKGVHTFDDMAPGTLRGVATDLTHTKPAVFPDDLKAYDLDRLRFLVARAVLMSAAVPFAFRTVKIPRPDGPKIHLADGAMAAKFPVQLATFQPGTPVVGLRLAEGNEAHGHHDIRGPLSLAAAVISSGMGARETLPNLCSGLRRVVHVPITHDPLDFQLTRSQALDLFDIGYEAGDRYFDAVDAGAFSFDDM